MRSDCARAYSNSVRAGSRAATLWAAHESIRCPKANRIAYPMGARVRVCAHQLGATAASSHLSRARARCGRKRRASVLCLRGGRWWGGTCAAAAAAARAARFPAPLPPHLALDAMIHRLALRAQTQRNADRPKSVRPSVRLEAADATPLRGSSECSRETISVLLAMSGSVGGGCGNDCGDLLDSLLAATPPPNSDGPAKLRKQTAAAASASS